jgi:hypothetical protein
MNQRKNSEKETVVEDAQVVNVDTNDVEVIEDTVNHFANIVLTGEADKLGAKSKGKVLYEIALNDEDALLYFRISGQRGGTGLHSQEWIKLDELFTLIESQGDKAWKSQAYKTLFNGGSANNHGFCGAIVRGLQLAEKSSTSIYLHTVGKLYLEKKAELLALGKTEEPKKK